MAIISIQRDRPAQREEVNKTDQTLDRILKGLQIVSNVYGIKTQSEQSDVRKAELERMKREAEIAERQASGIYTPQEIEKQGYIPAQKESDLAIKNISVYGPGGQVSEQPFIKKEDLEKKQALLLSTEKEQKADTERLEGIELKEREKYNAASKDTIAAISGYNKVKAQANTPRPNGASDMALLFGFMKSIDPGSVVRESEFRQADETTPIMERYGITKLRDQVLEGILLTPQQRMRILEASKRGVLSQLDVQNDFIDENFKNTALSFNLNPNRIINPAFSRLRMELSKDLQGVNAISSLSLPGESAATAQEPFDLNTWLMQNRQTQAPLLPGR